MAEAPDVDVDLLTDELYSTAPDEFVAARTATMKELRAVGRRDEAAAFAKLPKPVVAAWAVNVLSRRRPELVADVVTAGDRLRAAHTKGGGASTIRDAVAARQGALRAAVEAADELVGGRLTDAQRDAVAGTLEAAAADTTAAQSVRAGRLAQPLEAPSGFELLSGVATPPRSTPAKRRKAAATTTPGEADAGRDRLKALQSEAEHAAADAESARGEADAADQRVADLEAQRDRVAEQLDELAGQLAAARRAAREARRAAEQAERRAERSVARAARG